MARRVRVVTSGITFGIGGLAGITALLVGAIMSGRSARELGTIRAAVAASGSPPSAPETQRMTALQTRMKMGTQFSGC